MKKLLLVVPELGWTHASRQVTLIAPRLPRERLAVQLFSLAGAEPDHPLTCRLHDAAIPVYGRAGRRVLEVEDWLALRQRVRDSRPDLVHAFGLEAFRFLMWSCLGLRRALRIWLSPLDESPRACGWLTRRRLRQVQSCVVESDAAAGRWQAAGFGGDRLLRLPPAVQPLTRAQLPPAPLPPGVNRYLVMASSFAEVSEGRDAVWAFDILRYLDPQLHLILIGDGPARAGVVAFSHNISRGDVRTHFVGAQASVAPWLAQALALWIPARRPAGTSLALEALSLGTPVVASDLENLRELEPTGEMLLRVPAGDPPALARATRRVLRGEWPSKAGRSQVGERVRQRHDADGVAGAWAEAYERPGPPPFFLSTPLPQ